MALGRLFLAYTLFTVALIIMTILLVLATRADTARGTLHKNLSPSGLLNKDIFATIGFKALAGSSLPAVVLFVNAPQLMLSMLYFLYNSTCTSFMQAQEWNNFAATRKPLRVSGIGNAGSQARATIWLSLPPPYSMTLIALSGLLHWLVSRAIFLSKVRFLDFVGRPSQRYGYEGYGSVDGDHPGEMLAASYSSGAVLLVLLISCLMVVSLVVIGMWRIKHQITLVGSCSAGISAACHGEQDTRFASDESQELLGGSSEKAEGADEWARPLQWGVIDPIASTVESESDDDEEDSFDEIKQLGFSSRSVTSPRVGAVYR